MDKQRDFETEVRAVFELVKKHKKPYELNVAGINLTIFPNVFSPAYFTDSAWFAEEIPKIVGKKSLLEIGTGTGIVGLAAAINGAKVTITDINQQALANASYNFVINDYPLDFYLGDIYDNISADRKFDFIFWNHPFNKGTNPGEEPLLKAGFDYEYQSLEKYISQAHSHLNPSGRLLLGTGIFALQDEIKRIADENGYKPKILRKKEIPLAANSELKNDYRILEFVR